MLEQLSFYLFLGVQNGQKLLRKSSLSKHATHECHSLTNSAIFVRPQKFKCGLVSIFCTEHHSLRHDSSKPFRLHVSEDDDLVRKHFWYWDESLEPWSYSSKLWLTQVNFLNIQLFRFRMRYTLNDLSDTDIALGENLQLLWEISEWISRGCGLTFLVFTTFFCVLVGFLGGCLFLYRSLLFSLRSGSLFLLLSSRYILLHFWGSC